MDKNYLIEKRWQLVYALFANFPKKLDYLDIWFDFVDDDFYNANVFSDSLLMKNYVEIIKKYYGKYGDLPILSFLEKEIKKKYSGDECAYLLNKLEGNKEFNKRFNDKKVLYYIIDLSKDFVEFVKMIKIDFYMKSIKLFYDNSNYQKVAELSEKVNKTYNYEYHTQDYLRLGHSRKVKSNTYRHFRKLGIDFIDSNIRNGKGISTGEMVLGVVPSHRGKGLLSSQIGFNTQKNGIDVIHCFNEDDIDDVTSLYLAKFFNKPTDYFVDLQISEDSEERKLYRTLLKEYNDNNKKSCVILIKFTAKEFNIENIINTCKRIIIREGITNPRLIIDYFSLIRFGKTLSSDWSDEIMVFDELETFIKEVNGDLVAFDQTKGSTNYKDYKNSKIIDWGFVCGNNQKENKARHIFGVGADKDMLDKKIRYFNLFKSQQGQTTLIKDVKINPNTLNFEV